MTAVSVVDLGLRMANVRERFDQARTRANQRKLFLNAGDELISRLNNTLMTLVEDTFLGGPPLICNLADAAGGASNSRRCGGIWRTSGVR